MTDPESELITLQDQPFKSQAMTTIY